MAMQCNAEALPVNWALWKRKYVGRFEHLLLLCPWGIKVWKNCPLKIKYNHATISRIESCMLLPLSSFNGKVVGNIDASSLFGFLRWSIWKARNQFYFKGRLSDSDQVIFNAIS